MANIDSTSDTANVQVTTGSATTDPAATDMATTVIPSVDVSSDVFKGRPSRRGGKRWPYLIAGLGSALVTVGLLGFVAGAPVWANTALIVVGVVLMGLGIRGARA